MAAPATSSPTQSSSNPPSPMSWDAATASRLLLPPPPLSRFSATPPLHALPRPRPLYPSFNMSGSESWSLHSVPSIEPPGKEEAAAAAAAESRAAAPQQSTRPPNLGAPAARRPLELRRTPIHRDHHGVIGRLKAVDNLRAHSELCFVPQTRNHQSPDFAAEPDESRECRSYTFQDLNFWDRDESEGYGFVPTSLREFTNIYGGETLIKRPPARKRTSMRQLIRNQVHAPGKLRWSRRQEPADTDFTSRPESAVPVSWGRALPRIFPRMRA
jgi:hypothetical protein